MTAADKRILTVELVGGPQDGAKVRLDPDKVTLGTTIRVHHPVPAADPTSWSPLLYAIYKLTEDCVVHYAIDTETSRRRLFAAQMRYVEDRRAGA